MKSNKKLWLGYGILFILITVFMLFFASSTSPLFDNIYGYDSAFFRFMGASILKGKTPYADIWDHKGPVLYFIQTVGALRGTQNRKISLIFPMQILSLFVSILFLERSDALTSDTNHHRIFRFILLTICALPVFAVTMQGGNLSEDWSLPMICCSLYFFTKYAVKISSISEKTLTDEDFRHPRSYAFIHGICFGLLTFIRINNAVTICAGALVIGIFLILHKQWKNIIENIIFGILGFLVVTVPVCLWFAWKHALKNMLYAVFTFNFHYADINAHENYTGHSFIIRYLPIAFCLLLILIHLLRERKICFLDIISLTIVILNLILLSLSNVYLHYFMIFFPVFLFILIHYINIPHINILDPVLLAAFLLFIYPDCKAVLHWNFADNTYPIFPTANMYVPKDERNSMIAIDTTPEIYLIKGMEPCSRFVANQSLISNIVPEFKEKFKADLQNKKPIWIVTVCDRINPDAEIQNMIDTEYSYNFRDTYYCFYKRNE